MSSIVVRGRSVTVWIVGVDIVIDGVVNEGIELFDTTGVVRVPEVDGGVTMTLVLPGDDVEGPGPPPEPDLTVTGGRPKPEHESLYAGDILSISA